MSLRCVVLIAVLPMLVLLGSCGGVATTATEVAQPLPATEVPTKPPQPTEMPGPAPVAQGFVLVGAGFRTPESILYDPEADLYLVANINGSPSAKDGNGFISRVSPSGEVQDLKWIDGEAEGVTLSAPKGMAVAGNALYVADVDAVRVFERGSGRPMGEVVIAEAEFLNDVASAGDGRIYVTDSATGLVFVVSPDLGYQRFKDVQIKGLNGVFVADDGILVTAGGSLILKLDEEGHTVQEYETPAGSLDGIVLLANGAILVSSWQGQAVYHIDALGQATELFSGINAPADIGYDGKRGLVLIPLFEDDRVEAKLLP